MVKPPSRVDKPIFREGWLKREESKVVFSFRFLKILFMPRVPILGDVNIKNYLLYVENENLVLFML